MLRPEPSRPLPAVVLVLALLGVTVAALPTAAAPLATPPAILPSPADWPARETWFHQLPPEARRGTGPLFWLHGDETPARLTQVLDKVQEGGNGTFIAESRGHTDWLGPGWWRDLKVCLDAAKRLDLTMWIFDERWWPSHCVDGHVPPEHAAKVLRGADELVIGGGPIERDGFGGADFVAAVAGRVGDDDRLDPESLVDLAPFVSEGKLAWPAPPGVWRVLRFSYGQAPWVGGMGAPQRAVDGADSAAVAWYLDTVYRPHADHFGDDFGRTIAGFFYDEPETPGDWGRELPRVLAERGVDWKLAYVAHVFGLAGEKQAAADFQYRDAYAEAWGRTMFGGLTRWCHERGVASIGHFIEHGGGWLDSRACAGDFTRLQRYSDMGGMDVVFTQYRPGRRDDPAEPAWQMPKLASSVAHAFGKPDDLTMAEIFGARGQSLTYPEMKWWTDHLLVSGVNVLVPHSFNPRAPFDTDCPPYFWMDDKEPRWPLYRVWADYAARASLLLRGGEHVCPVAVLVAGNVKQVGAMFTPEQLSEKLQDALLDCDWLPCDVFRDQAALDGREVTLHGERYRVLVVPAAEAADAAVLGKARDFLEAGGIVVGYGVLPSRSTTLDRTAADIKALRDAIWGPSPPPALTAARVNAAGGRAYFLPAQPTAADLRAVLLDDAALPLPLRLVGGETRDWLHAVHRNLGGRDVFFLANQDVQGPARDFTFRVAAAGDPETWDALRDEITTPRWRRAAADTVEVTLALEPGESVFLVMAPEGGTVRPPRRDAVAAGTSRSVFELVREPVKKAAVAAAAGAADSKEAAKPDAAAAPHAVTPPAAGNGVTVSPLAAADPYRGHTTLPVAAELLGRRVILELVGLPHPEYAAAVMVNGQAAGGLIGRPFRLDVTAFVRPGVNTIGIAPLAPVSARLVVEGSAPSGGGR